jgi:hypothetical protein
VRKARFLACTAVVAAVGFLGGLGAAVGCAPGEVIAKPGDDAAPEDNEASIATRQYLLRVDVVGLEGHDLVLENADSPTKDTVTANGEGSFAFTSWLDNCASYRVGIVSGPVPTQACTVSSGTGQIDGSDATVRVTCIDNAFAVGGVVLGLQNQGLVLEDNGTDDTSVMPDGGMPVAFIFGSRLLRDQPYKATIKTQPQNQQCSIAGADGTVSAANVATVVVNCTPNTFTVGGTVMGLDGPAVLHLNGTNDLTVSANGSFAFPLQLNNGDAFTVDVATQPQGQTCTVTNGMGNVGTSDVSNVAVVCTTTGHRVEGKVSGLTGTGLVLVDNGVDALPIGGNGTFGFGMRVSSGQPYSVTVKTQPTGQMCTVQNGSGVMGNSDVQSITVTCSDTGPTSFTISGNVTGTGGGAIVLSNGAATAGRTGDGMFMFSAVTGGSTYDVRVKTPPAGTMCAVTNGTGTLTANVTNVQVMCSAIGPTCPANYFLSNGRCARAYLIHFSDSSHVNGLPNSCGTGIYTDPSSGAYGFDWQDELPTPGATVSFVEIDFVVGANSSPQSQSLEGFLNGVDTTYSVQSPSVSCATDLTTVVAQFQPIPLNAYLPGGFNIFAINPPTTDQYGFNKSTDVSWGGAFARVFVVY